MRVTNNMMVRKFTLHLDESGTNLNTLTDQVTTGMKYSKASEDTSSAIKAYKVRKSLAKVEQYSNNLSDLQGTLDETETSLMGINELITQATENLSQAANGTLSDVNRQTIADVFNSLKGQLLKIGNTNYAGKYIFGGPNTTAAPFTLDSADTLLYNGEDVNSNTINTEEVYADIGMGLAFDSGELDKDTAVSISTPGSLALGYGIDSDGLPKNAYNLFTQIISDLENNDTSNFETYISKLNAKSDDILVQVAGIGERAKFTEFLTDRLSADKLNLQKKQNSLESIDQAEAMTQYKSAELSYNAALQMGAKIIGTTLFDFLT
jgi:flagellar hook-associated protein 3 FlgL